jgi:hypothetical protein
MRGIGLVAAVLLTAACGTTTGTGSTEASALVAGPGSAHCPIEGVPEGPVPTRVAAAWVLRCSEVVRTVPGDGRWWFRVEERADTGIDRLLAALRRPDRTAPPGTACPDVGIGPSPIALVDAAGKVVHPRLPRDGCDQPQQQVRAALAALRFRETNATRMHQEQSQQSIDTGCGQMWTDLTGDMVIGRPAADRPTWRKDPQAVRVCLWQPHGSDLPRLVAAGTVAGADLDGLLDRLDRLPAAKAACTVPHQRFATLEYVRHGWYDSAAYAELDGCRRIVRPDGTLGELDPATAEVISQLA